MRISNSSITTLLEMLAVSSRWVPSEGYNSMGERSERDLAESNESSSATPLVTEDELYFVALSGLFTLPRLCELGYGDTATLRQYIAEDLLPTRICGGHYWLRLAEAGAAAGKTQGDVDENVAGGLVQLDSALEGLSNVQRGRIASLFRGSSQ